MLIHTKNKKRREYLKKIYPNERFIIPKNPYEIEYRIENSNEQKIKNFDFFISHSSQDSEAVQELIEFENKNGKNIFCDWINDADYLKRNLVCEATLKVLEKRLEQSKALIFVDSINSRNSVWCTYELNYYLNFKRPMYIINIQSIKDKMFYIEKLRGDWYKNDKYTELALLKENN